MNFGIIGAAGYVAPRHIQAIKDTGNILKVALDLNDSVGVLDKYFSDTLFFTSQERFDRHIIKNENLDFISICTPNYLHEFHCKFGMRLGSNVICEKPLALTVDNLLQLKKVEAQTGKKVYSILQLRLHPSIKLLKKLLDKNKKYKVEITYITPRGPWYFQSWKGDDDKSGGIETNIGIHFFDMLIWLFGDVLSFKVISRNKKNSTGELFLERADVIWNLSLDFNDLPNRNQSFYRNLKIDDESIRFDNVFSELHVDSYKEILEGRGYGIDDSIKAIELVQNIRNT